MQPCEKLCEVTVACLCGVEKRLRKPMPFVECWHQLAVTELAAPIRSSTALKSRRSFQSLFFAMLRSVQALLAAKRCSSFSTSPSSPCPLDIGYPRHSGDSGDSGERRAGGDIREARD